VCRPGRRPLFLALLPLLLLAGGDATCSVAAPPAAVDSLAAALPLWPLDLTTRYLTSNFMEYREGRFHAGIDLKTDGCTGWAVRAAEDGSVILLRALPEGYGRAVVLEGQSGRQYLYAHLERFSDRLRAAVTVAQRDAGRYRVEVELPPGALTVTRGEVLALSGQSGTVGPHLHLEVRNAAGWALDPLRHGFAVRDTIPPRLLRVTALPAAPNARVEGCLTARSVADTAGLPAELPLLRIDGAVAFAAEWEERSDRRGHRLAPRELRVRLDGEVVFTAANDSFPFARQAEQRLEWLETAGRRAQWLWRRPQSSLPGRAGGDWSLGGGGLTPGRHRVEITAADAAGNTAAVAWWLEVADPVAGADTAGDGGWLPDDVALQLPCVAEGGARRLTPFIELATGPDGAEEVWPLLGPRDADPPGWRRFVLSPGDGTPWLAPAVLFAAPDSLTGGQAKAALVAQGLAALGPAAWLLTSDWPAAGRPVIAWPGPLPAAAGARDVAAYRESAPGEWRWVGRLQGGGGGGDQSWSLALPGPGRYALLRDTRRPDIGAGPPGGVVRRAAVRHRAGISLPRWDVVAVTLADDGSGLDIATLIATLDGRPFIVEPDPIHGRLLAELPDNLAAGPHTLELRVADRAGLSAWRRLALQLVAAR
jgi:hypothetical protein